MNRTILVPPALAPAALAELKAWLAIGTAAENAALTALLRAAIELCEAFTGQVPLECECEVVLLASGTWQRLPAHPVLAVAGIDGIDARGERESLPVENYEIELDADGGARVRLLRRGDAVRVAVLLVAGIAEGWTSLPDGLRHGVLRLAAHLYRERDEAARATPPAAVIALWRPWRRVSLA